MRDLPSFLSSFVRILSYMINRATPSGINNAISISILKFNGKYFRLVDMVPELLAIVSHLAANLVGILKHRLYCMQ